MELAVQAVEYKGLKGQWGLKDRQDRRDLAGNLGLRGLAGNLGHWELMEVQGHRALLVQNRHGQQQLYLHLHAPVLHMHGGNLRHPHRPVIVGVVLAGAGGILDTNSWVKQLKSMEKFGLPM